MQKYSIRISGMDFNIVSDATPEDLQTITNLLNQKMDEVFAKSPRCSNAEAAILCALSYCSEKVAMQSTFQTLEESCRMRAEEIDRLREVVNILQSENDRLRKEKAEMLSSTEEKMNLSATQQTESKEENIEPKAEEKSNATTPADFTELENKSEKEPAEQKRVAKTGLGRMFEYLTFREEQ